MMKLDYDHEEENKCKECGNKVSEEFTRVFGDNSNEIEMCPDCASYRSMKDGAIEH